MAGNNNGNKSMMSLIIGAALGAAGVYLSDKKNREKVKDKFNQLKDEGKTKVDELKQKGSEGLENLQSKLEQKKDEAEEDIDDVKRELNE